VVRRRRPVVVVRAAVRLEGDPVTVRRPAGLVHDGVVRVQVRRAGEHVALQVDPHVLVRRHDVDAELLRERRGEPAVLPAGLARDEPDRLLSVPAAAADDVGELLGGE
jgi:hypothetical protein